MFSSWRLHFGRWLIRDNRKYFPNCPLIAVKEFISIEVFVFNMCIFQIGIGQNVETGNHNVQLM